MYWFDTEPDHEWDWNGGSSSSSPSMSNFEASTLPGPPSLHLRSRFQELVSEDESEDETDLQQQLLCCGPATTHAKFGMGNKEMLKVIPRVDVAIETHQVISESVDCGARGYGFSSLDVRQVV